MMILQTDLKRRAAAEEDRGGVFQRCCFVFHAQQTLLCIAQPNPTMNPQQACLTDVCLCLLTGLVVMMEWTMSQ